MVVREVQPFFRLHIVACNNQVSHDIPSVLCAGNVGFNSIQNTNGPFTFDYTEAKSR